MARFSDNMYGAVLMILSMAAFTLNDTFMKTLSGDMSLAQALFLRSLLATVAVVVWMLATGQFQIRTTRSDKLWMGVRAIAEVFAAFFFLTAVFNMPLANASAVLQALPLSVTLAGAVFFGESLGWRRMSAIAIGFVGVMLIIRPGTDGFTIYSLFALLAVLAITLRDLTTRMVTHTVSPAVITLWTTVLMMVCALIIGEPSSWVVPGVSAWLKLAGSVAGIMAAYVLTVRVMRVGEFGFTAPFRYSGMLWALLLGFAVFGDWPDRMTLVGAAIVVGSGVYTILRENYLRRASEPATDASSPSS